MEQHLIVVDGVHTAYYQAGSGKKVVVLLHGGGLDNAALSWELLIPELAKTHTVYALDWPGYGKSDTPDEKFVVSYYVEFFEKFINELNVDRVSLVGVSMGGAISIGFTLNNPQMVDRLVLVDSYGLQRKAPFHKLSYLYVNFPGVRSFTWWLVRQRWMIKYSLSSILKRPGSITDELVDRVHTQALQPGSGKAFGDLQDGDIGWNGLKTNYLERLPEIQQNTLIIHGEKDTLVPLSASQEAARLMPNAALTVMEGCGHWPQRDNPEQFNQLVTEFLKSTSPCGAQVPPRSTSTPAGHKHPFGAQVINQEAERRNAKSKLGINRPKRTGV